MQLKVSGNVRAFYPSGAVAALVFPGRGSVFDEWFVNAARCRVRG
jgi:hypothetical protein